MRDVKKREESRARLGLGPKRYVNGEVIYKGGEHLRKSCFHDKNQEVCFWYKFDLFYNQVQAFKHLSLKPLPWISSPRE